MRAPSYDALDPPRLTPTMYDPVTDTLSHSTTIDVLHRCFRVLLYLSLRLLVRAHVLLDKAAVVVHESLCRLLTLPPCAVYSPRESAMLIVGGDDGQYFRTITPIGR